MILQCVGDEAVGVGSIIHRHGQGGTDLPIVMHQCQLQCQFAARLITLAFSLQQGQFSFRAAPAVPVPTG